MVAAGVRAANLFCRGSSRERTGVGKCGPPASIRGAAANLAWPFGDRVLNRCVNFDVPPVAGPLMSSGIAAAAPDTRLANG